MMMNYILSMEILLKYKIISLNLITQLVNNVDFWKA